MLDNILEMDLNEDQERALRETLESFKEEVYSNLLEEVEQLKQEKIIELEEANEEWRTGVRKENTERMLDALSEMRTELKAEVTAELLESNPELNVLENIKELIAPVLDESFAKNTYAQELVTLRKKVEDMEEERRLEEGARTLADLIRHYSKKTQNILISVINEGGPEEVTEQFYKILESIDELDEGEDDDDYDDDMFFEDDDEDDDDDDEDDDDDDDDDNDDDDDDDDKKKKDDDDDDLDEELRRYLDELDTYIEEGSRGEGTKKTKNPLLERISELSK